MAVGVGAGGFVGVAPEVTANTYVAPTKYLLLRSESLNYVEDRVWRRPLKGIADVSGAVAGPTRVEGDISIEATSDQLAHLFKFMRGTVTKSGTGPYTYTFKPNHAATPAKTASITVVRNGVAFGYVGCVIGSFSFTVDGGLFVMNMTILGSDEANQSVPTATYVTATPYGHGQYAIEVPTATPVTDTDTFSFSVEDNAEAQYRLKNPGRGAQFIKYGERNVSATLERDFETRTDYDAYKALTAQSITLRATASANDRITILVPATIKDAYPVTGLSGQGDLIRASVTYMGTYDSATTQSYEIAAIHPTENVTYP